MKECCEDALTVIDFVHIAVGGTASRLDIEDRAEVNYCPTCGEKVDQTLRENALLKIDLENEKLCNQ